jgi:PAS domain-containing protein
MKSDNEFRPVESRASRDNRGFDIVAMGASAGGLRALSQILAALPANFPAAIVVVQHLDPRHRSLMAGILSRWTALHVEEAKEGIRLNLGTAYIAIAPPNRHLLSIPLAGSGAGNHQTMNEELQSTNEELQTVNEELRQRTDEVNRANAFLQSIVSSLRSGAVVIDQHFNILVWNHRAEDLWGLRETEVKSHSLLSLDMACRWIG